MASWGWLGLPLTVCSGVCTLCAPAWGCCFMTGRSAMPETARGKDAPDHQGVRCTGWCVKCCPGRGSVLRSCCCGWRSLNYATSGPAAPTKDAAPPAVKAEWICHPKAVVVVLGAIGLLLMNISTAQEADPRQPELFNPLEFVLAILTGFLFTYMYLAVSAKRWHDIGGSSYWNILLFIPFLGQLIIIPLTVVLGLLPGKKEDNKHGPTLRKP